MRYLAITLVTREAFPTILDFRAVHGSIGFHGTEAAIDLSALGADKFALGAGMALTEGAPYISAIDLLGATACTAFLPYHHRNS